MGGPSGRAVRVAAGLATVAARAHERPTGSGEGLVAGWLVREYHDDDLEAVVHLWDETADSASSRSSAWPSASQRSPTTSRPSSP